MGSADPSIHADEATFLDLGLNSFTVTILEPCLIDLRTVQSNNMGMTGRPRTYQREDAIGAAMNLFWRQGYDATSLDDLLQAMRLSKSSFYADFQSKEALYHTCLQQYQRFVVDHVRELYLQSPSLQQFLSSVFQEVVDDATSQEPKGCLIVNSAVEFGQHRKKFSAEVRTALDAVQSAFERVIREYVKQGSVSPEISPKVSAKYLTTCISGIRAMIKGGMSVKDAKAVVSKVIQSFELRC